MKIKDYVLTLTYKCSKTKKNVTVELKSSDFSASSSECEVCGSHGEVEIYWDCTSCGKSHTIELKSW